MKTRNIIFGALLSVLVSFAVCQQQQAATDTPDPGAVGFFNTADGFNALGFNASGFGNSGFGWFASWANQDGDFNTACGAAALDLNAFDRNTAVGAAALLLSQGDDNTAVGAAALENNNQNGNTAMGSFALFANTTGPENVAVGRGALLLNGTGGFSTAVGFQALLLNTGGQNTAVGDNALGGSTTGALNTALGDLAGSAVTTGSNIIAIGAFQGGVDSDLGELDDSCYISNIAGQPISAANFVGVVGVDTDGKLGTFAIDGNGNQVPFSSLMGTQKQAMSNRKIEELQATVARQQKQIDALTAGLQKVSAQLEVNKPAAKVVVNKQ